MFVADNKSCLLMSSSKTASTMRPPFIVRPYAFGSLLLPNHESPEQYAMLTIFAVLNASLFFKTD